MAISDNPGQTGSLAMSLAVSPLVVVAIILRFIATRRAARRVGAEDWCALLATLSCLGFNVLSIWCIAILDGREFTEIPLDTLKSILKASYITTQFFPLNQFFAKTSILLLYNRIFGIFHAYHVSIWILFVVNLLWTLAAMITLFFQCSPVEFYWNRLLPGGTCLDQVSLLIGFEVPNSSIDFAMVGLALVMLRDLRIRRRTRWKVMGFFAAGGFAGIIGFLKIATHFTAGQMSNTVLSLWGNAQMLLSILCCCVPIYNSLFSKRRSQTSPSYTGSHTFGTGNSAFSKGRKGPLLSDKTVGSISVSREYGSFRQPNRPSYAHGQTHGVQSHDDSFGLQVGPGSEKMSHHHHYQSHARNVSTESSSSAVLAPKTSNLSSATGTSTTLTATTTANSQTPLFAQQQPTNHSAERSQEQFQAQKPIPQNLNGTHGYGYGMEWARLYDQCSNSMTAELGLVPQTVTTVTAGDTSPSSTPPPPPPRSMYRPSPGHGDVDISLRPPVAAHLGGMRADPSPRPSSHASLTAFYGITKRESRQ
ncbi:hypothetical protein V8F20_010290 [Naviculisporaceae sp. PSN 640]